MASGTYPQRLQGNWTQDQSANSHKITSLLDPAEAQDAATKNYVDQVAQGITSKQEVRVATAAALPANTYANGTAGVGATLTASGIGILTVDGQNIVLNDRILVKNEVAPANNGVYTCTTAGTAGVAYILTRATDMDDATSSSGAQEYAGAYVYVQAGTANTGTGWVCNVAPSPTVGTTAITFVQFAGASLYTAGNGITIASNVITAVAAANQGLQVTGSGIGVLLNGGTLNTGASGIKISSGGVTATELNTSVFPAGSGLTGGGGTTASVQVAVRESVGGTMNGSNTAFTLAHTPKSGTEMLFLGRVLLQSGGGNDYTISGLNITMLTAPLASDGDFLATYFW